MSNAAQTNALVSYVACITSLPSSAGSATVSTNQNLSCSYTIVVSLEPCREHHSIIFSRRTQSICSRSRQETGSLFPSRDMPATSLCTVSSLLRRCVQSHHTLRLITADQVSIIHLFEHTHSRHVSRALERAPSLIMLGSI